MSEYVADTHALLWHFYAPGRLGRAAREVVVNVDRGAARVSIPAVVIAEAMMVAEKGRLPGLTLERLLARFGSFQDADNFRLSALLPDAVLSTHRLSAIPDIFDPEGFTQGIGFAMERREHRRFRPRVGQRVPAELPECLAQRPSFETALHPHLDRLLERRSGCLFRLHLRHDI